MNRVPRGWSTAYFVSADDCNIYSTHFLPGGMLVDFHPGVHVHGPESLRDRIRRADEWTLIEHRGAQRPDLVTAFTDSQMVQYRPGWDEIYRAVRRRPFENSNGTRDRMLRDLLGPVYVGEG